MPYVSPSAKSEPLAEFVGRQLREVIASGRLAPGERIRQEAVAAEYGTSRIPVREALRQLASEGLVVLTPNVGARVASLDLEELNEIYQIRECLEPFAIAQSAPRLSDEQLADLRTLAKEMEGCADPADRKAWLEIDRRFHFVALGAAPLPRLLSIAEGLWNRTGQYRRAYTALPQRLDMAHLEHRLLLDALERRDSSDAERLLQIHIRRTRLTLLGHMELFRAS